MLSNTDLDTHQTLSSIPTDALEYKLVSWTLRLLIEAKGYRNFFRNGRFIGDDILLELGIAYDETKSLSPGELLTLFETHRRHIVSVRQTTPS
ncbi:hypothetical protein FJM67_15830 [Maribrevibacterium harenarium]|uniref:Uncharacterized protein n=1 Tax=Maribrevibacterium harenarium TaxID=2589817 RepID=A0A501WAD3_9GAMM|nr:hypothetical protein [Maribrevibacterium harenarium]TPE46589.1 hypothetical protein FJM67_15830 [Maribrevibacterium harenarium]